MQPHIHVLVVDDDDIDAKAVQRALRKHGMENPVVVASDGEEALKILRGDGERDRLRQPYLVLLDLNMPRLNGHEVLAAIREDPALRESIVFVLTTSADERDRQAAYERNVAGYLQKGKVGRNMEDVVGIIEHYCRAVQFPVPE